MSIPVSQAPKARYKCVVCGDWLPSCGNYCTQHTMWMPKSAKLVVMLDALAGDDEQAWQVAEEVAWQTLEDFRNRTAVC